MVDEPILAIPLATSLPILGMFYYAYLHPPVAAVALIVALGHIMRYQSVLSPVILDSILLVIPGAIYSNLTGKRYPNRLN